MHAVPTLATLERRLVEARQTAGGTATELAALVELTGRLVSDPQRGGALAAEGVVLATRLGDDATRLRCRAMVAEFVSRQRSAADALPDALEILAEAEQGDDPLAQAQAHHTVAHCFDALTCTSEALEHVHPGLEGYQDGGDRLGEGRMFGFMASLFWELGENPRARELYERAYDIFLECDEFSGAGVMLSAIADLQCEAGDPEAAVATCDRALEHFEQAGMPLDSHMVMASYGEARSATGRHDLAGLWAKRAAERNRLPDGTVANPSYEIQLLMVLARTAQLPSGDFAGARATLERAVALADELGALRAAAQSESLLARALHASGDPAGAYEHLQRSRTLRHSARRRGVRRRPVQGHQRPVRPRYRRRRTRRARRTAAPAPTRHRPTGPPWWRRVRGHHAPYRLQRSGGRVPPVAGRDPRAPVERTGTRVGRQHHDRRGRRVPGSRPGRADAPRRYRAVPRKTRPTGHP